MFNMTLGISHSACQNVDNKNHRNTIHGNMSSTPTEHALHIHMAHHSFCSQCIIIFPVTSSSRLSFLLLYLQCRRVSKCVPNKCVNVLHRVQVACLDDSKAAKAVTNRKGPTDLTTQRSKGIRREKAIDKARMGQQRFMFVSCMI